MAGASDHCSIADLEEHLRKPGIVCLLFVSSRLTKGTPIDLAASIKAAHKVRVPTIVDCAAQDMRLPELMQTKADLFLVSAQKYLAAPTAGIIIGNATLVAGIRANEAGIGRSMKASKEAILGVLAAIKERQKIDMVIWRAHQKEKLDHFIEQANLIAGIIAASIADPTGLPFARASLSIDPSITNHNATTLTQALKTGNPSIRVMEGDLPIGQIILELVPLKEQELRTILSSISKILDA